MSFDIYLQELADPRKPLVVSELVKLSTMEPGETPLLLNAWPEMEVGRRRRLIQALVDLAEDNIELNFDAVYFVALADSDAEVRRNAVKGLWEYEGRDLIDPLVGLLRGDPDAAVRAQAALALGRFVLQAEFGTLRAADADRVEGALCHTVDDVGEVTEVRGRALGSIGACSKPWVGDLIRQAFESPDRRLRLSALHAMGRSCDAAWLPRLVPALESDDPEMRFEAARACGSITDEAATPHLLPLLHDEDREVQEAAIGALSEIGSREAKRALEALLEDADDRAREAVVSALAEVDFAEDPLGFELRE